MSSAEMTRLERKSVMDSPPWVGRTGSFMPVRGMFHSLERSSWTVVSSSFAAAETAPPDDRDSISCGGSSCGVCSCGCSGMSGLSLVLEPSITILRPVTQNMIVRQIALMSSSATTRRQRAFSPPRRLKNISHSSSVYCIVWRRMAEFEYRRDRAA